MVFALSRDFRARSGQAHTDASRHAPRSLLRYTAFDPDCRETDRRHIVESLTFALGNPPTIMPPSEASILRDFLLPPAPLPAIISLRQFTDLFPRAYHANPLIKDLYRELQEQRAIDTDDVRRNITAEVKRGEKQKRHISKIRQKSQSEAVAGIGSVDIEMEAEVYLLGQHVIVGCQSSV